MYIGVSIKAVSLIPVGGEAIQHRSELVDSLLRVFTDSAIVLSMLMLSFIFAISA